MFAAETVFVTGSLDKLGRWDPNKAAALSPRDYPFWTGDVTVPANTNFEYKYIKKHGSNVIWEPRGNRDGRTPAKDKSSTIKNTWGK